MKSNDPINPLQVRVGGLYHIGEIHGYDMGGEFIPRPTELMHERLAQLRFILVEDVYAQPEHWVACRTYPGEATPQNVDGETHGDLSLYESQYFRSRSQVSWDYLKRSGFTKDEQYTPDHKGLAASYAAD